MAAKKKATKSKKAKRPQKKRPKPRRTFREGAIEVEIDDVSGVSQARFELPYGLTAFTGTQATGKTSAIRDVVGALEGSGLEVRDGADEGRVRIGDYVATISRFTKPQTEGEAQVEIAPTSPFSDLVWPDYESQEVRDEHRFRALLRMLDLTPTQDDIRKLSGGDDELCDEFVSTRQATDLVDAVKQMRLTAQKMARSVEAELQAVKGAAGEVKARRDSTLDRVQEVCAEQGVDVTQLPSSEKAEAERRRLRDLWSGSKAKVQEAERAEKRLADIKATLPDVDPDVAGKQGALEAAVQMREAAESEVAKRQKELHEAQARLAEKKLEEKAARVALEDAESLAQKISEVEGAAKDAGRVNFLRSNLEKNAERLERAEAMHTAALLYEEVQEISEDLVLRERRARLLEDRAEGLRETAGSLYSRLSDIIVKKVKAPKVKVDDDAVVPVTEGVGIKGDRVVGIVDGKAVPWEDRMSEGQRVDRALDLWMETAKPNEILVISKSAYHELPPKGRVALGEKIRRLKIRAVTEETTDDPKLGTKVLG